MSKGKLITIEAGDGSGKATQTKALYDRLLAEGYQVLKVEYPDYQSESSALVRMYLGGEFGQQAENVSAYGASSFFAVDRCKKIRGKAVLNHVVFAAAVVFCIHYFFSSNI